MGGKTRYISRGICIYNDRILLATSAFQSNFHLPGGKINTNESAELALKREIKEEINKDINIHNFLGVFENKWRDKKETIFETNFIFSISFNDGIYDNIKSNEQHLYFNWFPIEEIHMVDIRPKEISPHLKNFVLNKNQGYWFSNFNQLL